MMLTRFELDGFKSFEDFELDLSPFTVILGMNASGKSNLFDAIQFLSRLASQDLLQATEELRGEIDELFRKPSADSQAQSMRFAVEVLVEPKVRDPWGEEVPLTHTRIRYELVIESRKDEHGVERLVVAEESAVPILKKQDRWRPFGNHVSPDFKERYLKYRRQSAWLETETQGGQVSFKIRQDGKQGRTRPGHAPQATVLSSVTTAAEFPHLFALREEMRHWRLLQLDPGALRRPSSFRAPDVLLADGSNLAAVLARIRTESRDDGHPEGAIAEIGHELASILPGVHELAIEEDEHSREFRPFLTLRDGLRLPTRVISDGTLRVLALLTALLDPSHRGLICFEEPENGVHPARLRTLIQRLRTLVSDPNEPRDPGDEPLSQLLLNSHSPVVLSALHAVDEDRNGELLPSQICFADMIAVADAETKSMRRKTRIRSVTEESFLFDDFKPGIVTAAEVKGYLATVDQEA